MQNNIHNYYPFEDEEEERNSWNKTKKMFNYGHYSLNFHKQEIYIKQQKKIYETINYNKIEYLRSEDKDPENESGLKMVLIIRKGKSMFSEQLNNSYFDDITFLILYKIYQYLDLEYELQVFNKSYIFSEDENERESCYVPIQTKIYLDNKNKIRVKPDELFILQKIQSIYEKKFNNNIALIYRCYKKLQLEWTEMQVLFDIRKEQDKGTGMYNNNNNKTSKQLLEEEEEFQRYQIAKEENYELYKTINPKKVLAQDAINNAEFLHQQIEPEMLKARIRIDNQAAINDSIEIKVSKRDTLYIPYKNDEIEEETQSQWQIERNEEKFCQKIENTILCFKSISKEKTFKNVQILDKKDQETRKIIDFQHIRNKYELHNHVFHQQFIEIASEFFTLEKIKNPFDRTYYEKVLDNMISQIPFQTLTVDIESANDLIDQHLVEQQAIRFNWLVNYNLVHIASYNYGVQESSGIVLKFNTSQIPEKSKLRESNKFCIQLKKMIMQKQNKFQQLAIYFHQKNMMKFQDVQNFEFYFSFALIEKFFLVPDFLGIPLFESELQIQNYQDALIRMQKSYIKNFDPVKHVDYEPYKSNLEIDIESYRQAQEQQRILINNKLNKF
ncbi:hypothetical protein TTHERM_01076810 (macronuclear) [Tetrahymena thermophila SB210]|uniref:Uncharacterized protein n=1 Tax=Tetrahymena thermophila (strain SB210) TaxID=312017 RepID=Q22C58_TETTS|nr:hypothetical protein TTHERM_01076810 [Tetrahymena thermophila SB210]EAR82854.2 hypothetical protein TTHERM_01076810 [Tetrahymena thermophila SB210]|eukprot:XP_001030517.2 hypothetical protein TTHERM_01076810 [Tetrahymena thermophila SB210]